MSAPCHKAEDTVNPTIVSSKRSQPLQDVTNRSEQSCQSHGKFAKYYYASPEITTSRGSPSSRQTSWAPGTGSKRFAIDLESVIRGLEPITERLSARSTAHDNAVVDYPPNLEEACRMIDQQREDIIRALEVGQQLLCRLAEVETDNEQLCTQLSTVRNEHLMLEQDNKLLRRRCSGHFTELRSQNIVLQEMLLEKEQQIRQDAYDRLQKSHQEKMEREMQEMSHLSSFCQSPRPPDFLQAEPIGQLEQRYLEQLKENSKLCDQLQDLEDQLHLKDEQIQALMLKVESQGEAPVGSKRDGVAMSEEEAHASFLTSPCISVIHSPHFASLTHEGHSQRMSPPFCPSDASGSSILKSCPARPPWASLQKFSIKLQAMKQHYLPSRILDFNDIEGDARSTARGTERSAVQMTPGARQQAPNMQSFSSPPSNHIQHGVSPKSDGSCVRMSPDPCRDGDTETVGTTYSTDWEMASEGTWERALGRALSGRAQKLYGSVSPSMKAEDTPGRILGQEMDYFSMAEVSMHRKPMEMGEVEITMDTDFSSDVDMGQCHGQSCRGGRPSDVNWEALQAGVPRQEFPNDDADMTSTEQKECNAEMQEEDKDHSLMTCSHECSPAQDSDDDMQPTSLPSGPCSNGEIISSQAMSLSSSPSVREGLLVERGQDMLKELAALTAENCTLLSELNRAQSSLAEVQEKLQLIQVEYCNALQWQLQQEEWKKKVSMTLTPLLPAHPSPPHESQLHAEMKETFWYTIPFLVIVAAIITFQVLPDPL